MNILDSWQNGWINIDESLLNAGWVPPDDRYNQSVCKISMDFLLH